jgi:predicted dinucleotide-binding enzyme
MKIGVIGIGNIGGTLAHKLAAAGHEVRVANSKGPDDVRSFAEEIGGIAVDVQGAVTGADAVIVAIPLPAMAQLSKTMFANLPAEVPVIDTSNYYPGLRDPQISELDEGQVESLWVSSQLGRPVIKAFNNILAYSLASLGSAEGTPGRLAIAVAGDDAQAKQVVMGLVTEVGFDPVDTGSLAESWRQQPATPGYCCDYDAATMHKALEAAVRENVPEQRERMFRTMAALGSASTHAEIIAVNRTLIPLD